jgi:glutathione S-transferase
MLELYQSELSPYSEKVRLMLDYKGLAYRKIEVTPGVGQIEVYRLSGQPQVPVLKDGNVIVADSTEIAKYLDRQYPDRPLIPAGDKQRGLCMLMEEWADESIGAKSQTLLFSALSSDASLRSALLPPATPDFLRTLVEGVPGDLLKALGTGIGAGSDAVSAAMEAIKQDLESLCLLLQDSPYLVGSQPTLADFAVAGLSMFLKFPEGQYLDIPEKLKGKGVPGIADNSLYAPFFSWRDRLYDQYRQPLTPTSTTDSAPTSIQIE